MKAIGKVTVINAVKQEGKKGVFFRCNGFTDDGELIQFFRPDTEQPKKDDVYILVLDYYQFKPIVKVRKND